MVAEAKSEREAKSDRRFKWAQLAITTSFGVLLTLGGNVYLKQIDQQTEVAKLAQADREFSVHQKDAEVELATKMFTLLMERYLKQDTMADRLLTLRLLALNFSDVPINLRPMFQNLERRITRGSDREQLRQIGREVARRQAFRLTVNDGERREFKGLRSGSEVLLQGTTFSMHVNSVAEDAVQLELIEGDSKDRIGPFSVTYYDWPLIDNTKLGDKRIALMLLNSSGDSADIRVIRFPSDLAPDRFDIKEVGSKRIVREQTSRPWWCIWCR